MQSSSKNGDTSIPLSSFFLVKITALILLNTAWKNLYFFISLFSSLLIIPISFLCFSVNMRLSPIFPGKISPVISIKKLVSPNIFFSLYSDLLSLANLAASIFFTMALSESTFSFEAITISFIY